MFWITRFDAKTMRGITKLVNLLGFCAAILVLLI